MTQEQIVKQFGSPTDVTWDSRSFGYGSFFVMCGGREASIWRVTLKKGVSLSSGISAGSSREDVRAVFGSDQSATSGQYKLSFEYNDDGRLRQMKIEPTGSAFVDYAPTSVPPSTAAQTQVKQGITAKSLAGTWWCIKPSWSSGTIELKEDGSYTRPAGVKGRFRVEGNEVVFDGNLQAWNKGRAKLEYGCLVFEWTNPDGSMQYFAFSR